MKKTNSYIHFGDIMREKRLSYGYTLQELSEECNCSISTLSRIESSGKVPAKRIFDMLSSILDIDLNYEALLYNQEMHIESIRNKIIAKLSTGNDYDIDVLLIDFKNATNLSSIENKQFITISTYIWYLNQNRHVKDLTNQLLSLIRLSINDFSADSPYPVSGLNYTELLILNLLSISLIEEGNSTDSLKIFAKLLFYFNSLPQPLSDIDLQRKAVICNNIAVCFLTREDYYSANTYCNTALKQLEKVNLCYNYFKVLRTKSMLPDILNSLEANNAKNSISQILSLLSNESSQITKEKFKNFLDGPLTINIL